MAQIPERQSMKERVTRSPPVRTFGRAMSVLGNGARSVGSGARNVLEHPLKRAKHRSKQIKESPELPEETQQGVELQPANQTLHTLGENWGKAVNNSQQKLSNHIQDSADFLRRCWQQGPASSSNYLAAGCFPPRLVTTAPKKLGPGEDEQMLVCTGSRTFLNVKLYDFAVYLDPKQARRSALAAKLGKKVSQDISKPDSEVALTTGLRDSRDIDMALMVRASRNLPILLLAKEYERILRRRLRVVGGLPSDPALHSMLDTFREHALPEDIKQGSSVKKGTVITFTRDGQGSIEACANEHSLVKVQSQKLAQAVFDIYLGSMVVSKEARRDAGASFIKMVASDEEFEPLKDSRICAQEACQVGRLR